MSILDSPSIKALKSVGIKTVKFSMKHRIPHKPTTKIARNKSTKKTHNQG